MRGGGEQADDRQGRDGKPRNEGAPDAGASAYVGVSGLIGTSDTNSVKVGQFLSGVDSDGYAKVSVNIA